MTSHKFISIIPARKGSKGLPGKNIIALQGKPLICHSIDASIASKIINNTVVSTDDPRIIGMQNNIYNAYGPELTFLQRPDELALDASPTIDAVLHVADSLALHDNTFIVLLQPTSPLRTAQDIVNAVNLIINGAQSVVSLTECEHHPFKSFVSQSDNTFTPINNPDDLHKPRQLLPKAYRQNGAIYINKLSDLRSTRVFCQHNFTPYLMPQERSIDIDTALDIQYAEMIMQHS
jgi:CMP-N,N'-diacetyllegionaminic acid synthase